MRNMKFLKKHRPNKIPVLSIYEQKLGVHFSPCWRGVLNNQIVAATSAGTFLRPSVAPRYSASPSRSILVQTEGLPLTSKMESTRVYCAELVRSRNSYNRPLSKA